MTADGTEESRRRERRQAAAAIIALLSLVLVVFGRVSTHQWLDYDDRFHVVDNPRMRAGFAGGVVPFWRGQYGNLYIPVAYAVFWGEARIAVSSDQAGRTRFDPRVFHAGSLLLHGATTLLVFAVLRRLRTGVFAGMLGAAVFAVHPLQAESVAWASEQRGLLAGLFSCAALLMYLRWRGTLPTRPDDAPLGTSRGHWAWYGAASACFALALLSKPSAATLPLMIGMIDVFRRERGRSIAVALSPWLALSLAVVLITRSLQPGTTIHEAAPLWARPLIAGDALAFYLWKLLWPLSMSPDYGRTPRAALAGWWAYAAWSVPLAVLVIAVLLRRLGRAVPSQRLGAASLVCLGVLVAALLPVLGLATFDHQNISTVADRYMYLAMVGPAVLAGAVVSAGSPGVRAAASLLVVGLAVRTFYQSGTWRDDRTLWSHSLTVSPHSATTLTNLGFALAREGRHAEAIKLYQRALAERPDLGLANINLAFSTMDTSGPAPALPLFERAVAAAPRDARSHLGKGVALARLGRISEGADCFEHAIELDPANAESHGNLALARMQLGENARAAEEFKVSLALNAEDASVWFNLGLLREHEGAAEDAIRAWSRAVELQPSLAAAWYRLGDAYARGSRLPNAERAYASALAADPAMADAANNLGLVYIRLERVDDAIAAFQRAIVSNPAHPEARDNLTAAEKLKQRTK